MTRPPRAPRLISIQLPSSVLVVDDELGLTMLPISGSGASRALAGAARARLANDGSPVPGWCGVAYLDLRPEAGPLTSGAAPQIPGESPLDAGLDLHGKPRDTRRCSLHSGKVGAAEWGERWAGRNNAASARPLAVGRLMRTDPSTDLGIDF